MSATIYSIDEARKTLTEHLDKLDDAISKCAAEGTYTSAVNTCLATRVVYGAASLKWNRDPNFADSEESARTRGLFAKALQYVKPCVTEDSAAADVPIELQQKHINHFHQSIGMRIKLLDCLFVGPGTRAERRQLADKVLDEWLGHDAGLDLEKILK